jgi:3-phenylpropionate/trans-cinnamate dioxygenase ferredoxin reductase subunit
MVVVGGGYVGLEVAASARTVDVEVTLLEAQPRLLARVAGPQLSGFYQSVHESRGVAVVTGAEITSVECNEGRITALCCSDGRIFPADLVVAGIGMLPNVEPAIEAGLAGRDGIPVDANSVTADADILAAGDCTLYFHPLYQRQVRVESVPNALEQARAGAGWVCGKPKPNLSVPWFWSDQYDLKLQIAGLSEGHDAAIVRGSIGDRSFCVFYLREERLLAVEAVNRPADFMAARRVLAAAPRVDARALADDGLALRNLLKAFAAGGS